MSQRGWDAADIPDQTGRAAVITGANSGLGFQAARYLAGRGAVVVLTGRDPGRITVARDRLLDQVAGARLDTVALDLASLESVREAATASQTIFDRSRRDRPRGRRPAETIAGAWRR